MIDLIWRVMGILAWALQFIGMVGVVGALTGWMIEEVSKS